MASPNRFRSDGKPVYAYYSSTGDLGYTDSTKYSQLCAMTSLYSFDDYKAEKLLNSLNCAPKKGFRSPKGTRSEVDLKTQRKIWEAEKKR